MQLNVAYTPQFRQFLRQNQGLIRKFAEAYKSGAEIYEDGTVRIAKYDPGIVIERDGRRHRNGERHLRLWIVETPERKLFVKETERGANNETKCYTGVKQYGVTVRLDGFAKALSRVWGHGVEILPVHLGATYGKTSFLVMDYCTLPRASESRLPRSVRMKFLAFAYVANIATGIMDIWLSNAFYDSAGRKMVVIDPGKSIRSLPYRIARYAIQRTKFWLGVFAANSTEVTAAVKSDSKTALESA